MHALLRDLFPYLVGFFLLDCVLYVRRGQVAFLSSLGRRFRVVEHGLRLILPWPTTRVVVAEDLLVGFSEQGMHVRSRETPGSGILPEREQFDIVDPSVLAAAAAEGRGLVDARGRRLCIAASNAGARAIRSLAASVKGRGAPWRLDGYHDRLADPPAVRARRIALETHLVRLQVLSAILWLGLFIVLPWTIYADDRPAPPLALVLAGLAVAYLLVLWAARSALRACGLGRSEYVRALLPALLFPPAASHILSVIERDLHAPAATSTVAAAFLDPDVFLRFASGQVRRISIACQSAIGSAAEPVWRGQHAVSDAVLRRSGSSVAALLAVPLPRSDASAASRCPLCATEYRGGVSHCSECDVQLEEY